MTSYLRTSYLCTSYLRLGWILATLLLFVAWPASQASAQGVLLLKDSSSSPLILPRHPHHWPNRVPPTPPRPTQLYRIADLQVQATLQNGVAQVTLNQVFENQGSSVSEVSAVFPLPADAAVSGMTFLVDGKEIEAKVMGVDEARSIYESYVRRTKDPALVQWIGTGMIRTNVFPIPPSGKRTVTLNYTQVLPRHDGLLDWQLLLSAAGYSTEPIQSISVSARIINNQNIGNIYSPTHNIKVDRASDKEAYVKFSATQFTPAGNFRLLTDDRASEIASQISTFRPSPSEDGYFMLLMHPEFRKMLADDVSKNIVLVLDKSGSMRGEKMEQARNALLYVLDNLKSTDHFGVVVYDGTVQTFREELKSANSDDKQAAKVFVKQLEASGSTNIDQALQSSFSLIEKSDRPSYIVFLTDGAPTVGERDPQQIVAHATSWNKTRARVLSFGVGHDVNSQLLDRISRNCFGQSFFVSPEENIEESISNLYKRIGEIALTEVRWSLKDSQGNVVDAARQVYPNKLYDMFSGDQLTVLGRYNKFGSFNLVLEGKLGSEEKKWEFPVQLQESTSGDRSYIASLWAIRRVSAIIDEIDLEGSKESLVKELVDLSKRYGILTPYTAFLAEEPEAWSRPEMAFRQTSEGLDRLKAQVGGDAFAQRGLKKFQGDTSNASQLAENQRRSSGIAGGGGMGGMASGPGAPSSSARDRSFNLAAPSQAGGAPAPAQPTDEIAASASTSVRVKQAHDRAFFLRDGKWIDSTAQEDQIKKVEVVERFGTQYFDIVAKNQILLSSMLDQEEPIVVVIDGKAYQL